MYLGLSMAYRIAPQKIAIRGVLLVACLYIAVIDFIILGIVFLLIAEHYLSKRWYWLLGVGILVALGLYMKVYVGIVSGTVAFSYALYLIRKLDWKGLLATGPRRFQCW